MDLKVFRDTLCTMTVQCETKTELPVETEILIPDYQPQVFKIVKCFVHLVPLQKQVMSGRLTVEGYLRCVVYYQTEDDQSLCQTEQKLPFNRVIDLPEGDYAGNSVELYGEVEYLNCRAVNQRRIDVRGAYALNIAVCAQNEQEIVTALADCGVEQKMIPVSGIKVVASVDKIMTAEEEITLSSTPQAILDITGIGVVDDIKLISGKAVVKGRIKTDVAYRSEAGYQLETAQKDVPFNQIIDLEMAPEDATAFAHAEMVGCTMMAVTGQEGVCTLTVTAVLHLRVMRKAEYYVVSDAFSTQYTTDTSYKNVVAEQLLEQLDQSAQAATGGTLPDENAQVIGCFASVHALEPAVTESGDGFSISGRGTAHVLCLNSLGEIDCYDKAFDFALPGIYVGSPDQYRMELWPVVEDVSAQKSGGEMTAQAVVRVHGLVFKRAKETVVAAITCEELLQNEEPDVALRICYAAAGENIFDIAKHYHVSPTAMMQSNELEDLQLNHAARLLVPMTV